MLLNAAGAKLAQLANPSLVAFVAALAADVVVDGLELRVVAPTGHWEVVAEWGSAGGAGVYASSVETPMNTSRGI